MGVPGLTPLFLAFPRLKIEKAGFWHTAPLTTVSLFLGQAAGSKYRALGVSFYPVCGKTRKANIRLLTSIWHTRRRFHYLMFLFNLFQCVHSFYLHALIVGMLLRELCAFTKIVLALRVA